MTFFFRTIIYLGCILQVIAWPIQARDVWADADLRDEIAIVAIEDRDFDASWRTRHAELLKRLSEVGARVVVFDMFFETTASAHDALFLDAIRQARKRGTGVVVGFRQWRDDGPVMDPAYRRAVSGYGLACIGITEGGVIKAPLAVIKRGAYQYFSLCLEAVKCYFGGTDVDLEPDSGMIRIQRKPFDAKRHVIPDAMRFPFDGIHRVKGPQTRCEAVGPEDDVMEIVLTEAPVDLLRADQRRSRYRDAVAAFGPDELVRRFNGKIVLVGVQNGVADVHECGSIQCHGVELMATAVGMILNQAELKGNSKER